MRFKIMKTRRKNNLAHENEADESRVWLPTHRDTTMILSMRHVVLSIVRSCLKPTKREYREWLSHGGGNDHNGVC